MSLKSACAAALGLLLWCSSARAATYFVSGTGNDAADGLSIGTAFRTLQHAADRTRPGDAVNAMDGLYTNARPDGAVLAIEHSGTQSAWITYRAYPGQTPRIAFNGWAGVQFGGRVSYIEVNGFTIVGNNRNVTLAGALKQGKVADPIYSGNCIAADGRKGTATEKPHHLRILNNVVSECGGGGIATIQADYVTIAGNTVFDSAWYAIYGCSGISMLENWNSDETPGYKMVITGNRVFGNRELVPWIEAGKITDGEGIIVDTSRSPTLSAYRGRTLIANNVVYDNGSAGIEVFKSDHVDIVNNATYANVTNRQETGNGELNLNDVADIHVLNNIFSSAKGENPLMIVASKPCQCFLGWNLYYGGSRKAASVQGVHELENDLEKDPRYVDPSARDRLKVDLSVNADSPAVDTGDARLAPSTDIRGVARPQGAGVDRGAYER